MLIRNFLHECLQTGSVFSIADLVRNILNIALPQSKAAMSSFISTLVISALLLCWLTAGQSYDPLDCHQVTITVLLDVSYFNCYGTAGIYSFLLIEIDLTAICCSYY